MGDDEQTHLKIAAGLGVIVAYVLLEQIVEQLELQAGDGGEGPALIFYGVHTCWWAHHQSCLYATPEGLPCDPRGSVLLEARKWGEFLANAQVNPGHYGRHGLKAFMGAHHLNCRVRAGDHRSTSFCGWDAYNRILDRQGGEPLPPEPWMNGS